jgi:hypothetical protein
VTDTGQKQGEAQGLGLPRTDCAADGAEGTARRMSRAPASVAPYKHALAARVRARYWGLAESESVVRACGWWLAGHDLVGGIDHGPGSNQPVHHLRMTAARRSVKRSPAVLRCEARQEVKRESLCCLCHASSQRGV